MDNPGEGHISSRPGAVDGIGFDQFLIRSHPRVVRFVHRLIGWRPEVDEIVQDVFAAAWQSRLKFRGECAPETWLLGIAAMTCRRWRFRAAAARKLHEAMAHASPHVESGVLSDALLDSERAERVREAVRALPHADREVIILRYLEEMPAAEICRVLRVSSGALDVRLHRARRKLEMLLHSYMSEDSL